MNKEVKLDENLKSFLERGPLFRGCDSNNVLDSLLAGGIFIGVQYIRLRIIPTAIVGTYVLYLLIFRKKFKEPYGNLLYTVGEGIFFSLAFAGSGVIFLSFATSEEIVKRAGIMMSFLLVVGTVFNIWITNFCIKRGMFVNAKKKKAVTRSVPMSGMTMLGAKSLHARTSDNFIAILCSVGCFFVAILFLNCIDAGVMYYYFKHLTPEEQKLVLEQDIPKKNVKRKRSVVNINKVGEKDNWN